MAWTKCLKQPVLQKYCDIIKDQEEKRKTNKLTPFKKLVAYEDFTDYMIFLFDKIRITAITDTVYSYKKHDHSITSNLTDDSFKLQRIGFLHYLIDSVYNPKDNISFDDDKKDSLTEFLKYKTYVISEILEKNKSIGYPVNEFWEDYKDTTKILSSKNANLDSILNNTSSELEKFYKEVSKHSSNT